MTDMDTVLVAGYETVRLSRDQLTTLMVADCSARRAEGGFPRLVFDLNGHGIALACWNQDYRRDLLSADIIHADGQPIVLSHKDADPGA